MEFNAKKCYVLRVSHSKSIQHFSYTLNNTVLQETAAHTYLGVDLSHDLKWNTHVNRIAAKANKTLGFILVLNSNQRNGIQITGTSNQSWTTAPLWDPHTKNLTNQLEAIQNRAARFVSGIYGRDSSITKIKQDLKWETLQQRRTVDRLTIFQQAVAGNLAIPVQNVLRPVTRNLRNTSTTANSFIPIQANKNCYKFSFIPRTIIDWNALPQSITNIRTRNNSRQQ